MLFYPTPAIAKQPHTLLVWHAAAGIDRNIAISLYCSIALSLYRYIAISLYRSIALTRCQNMPWAGWLDFAFERVNGRVIDISTAFKKNAEIKFGHHGITFPTVQNDDMNGRLCKEELSGATVLTSSPLPPLMGFLFVLMCKMSWIDNECLSHFYGKYTCSLAHIIHSTLF